MPLWEELYRSLPPAGQEELLALAARQGLLYAHQLPAIDPALLQQRRQFLQALLAGKARDLAPVTAGPVSLLDSALDPAQREAVARALAVPDVCLIQGLPGSGKSRVAAEIVTQAAMRGERVLLLATTSAALDRILEQAGRHAAVCAIRCLQPGETSDSLPVLIRPLTFEARARYLRETSVETARAAASKAQQQVADRRAGEQVWNQLAALAETSERVEARLAALDDQRAKLPDDVAQGWGSACESSDPSSIRVRACLHEHEQQQQLRAARRSELEARRAAVRRDRPALATERDALRPLVEAREHGHWWALAWWKSRFDKTAQPRHEEVARRLSELDTQEKALDEEALRLDQEKAEAEASFARQRQELLAEETARRTATLEQEATAIRRECDVLEQQWSQACQGPGASACLTSRTVEAVAAGRRAWQALLSRDEEQAAFTERWAASLEAAAPALPERLAACANLVAGTPAGLAADPHFTVATSGSLVGPGAGRPTSEPLVATAAVFDLLVVEEADLFGEPELLQAARRARRWVLIGEPDTPTRVIPNRRPVPPRLGAFARLWQQLHCSPRQLPFCWERTADRLCCRLRPIPEDQKSWLATEPVADRPEIELVILAPPRQEPALVEVRFPRSMPVCQAKEFILRELQEVAADIRGPALFWTENDAGLRLQVGDVPACVWDSRGSVDRVSLAEGLREVFRFTEDTCDTLGFEFDCAGGWTRKKSEAWLATHLGLRDLGRTAYLGRLYRPCPGLAAFLSDVLFREAAEEVAADTDGGVRLVPVPAPERGSKSSLSNAPPRSAVSAPRPAGGAGFEIELSSPQAFASLPAELKVGLPRQGLINHREGLAVVQALEELITDPGFRAEASAWRQGPAIMVTALYESQVRLLRLLVSRSAALTAAGLTSAGEGRFILASDGMEIVVEPPPALRQRETLALLLSLTRSHSHRAVALGEQASWLPLALTRPAGRLVLFGDAGTLARRVQWHGAVDHLDEAAAERERELVSAIGLRLAAFGLPDGRGTMADKGSP